MRHIPVKTAVVRRTRLLLRAVAVLGAMSVLSACREDPDDGVARLEQVRPDVDEAGSELGEALEEALGGRVDPGTAQYDLCSSAPVEGLSYYARWALRAPDARPTLDLATEAAETAGWEVGETSEAEGFIPASTYVSRGGVQARLSVDEGVLVWSAKTECVRVTPEDASKLLGPVS